MGYSRSLLFRPRANNVRKSDRLSSKCFQPVMLIDNDLTYFPNEVSDTILALVSSRWNATICMMREVKEYQHKGVASWMAHTSTNTCSDNCGLRGRWWCRCSPDIGGGGGNLAGWGWWYSAFTEYCSEFKKTTADVIASKCRPFRCQQSAIWGEFQRAIKGSKRAQNPDWCAQIDQCAGAFRSA